MLVVTVAGLCSWFVVRRVQSKWSFAVFLIVTVMVSIVVIDDVRTAGVMRDDTGPAHDRVYSIVYCNSTALFPFVIQKHHNWTAKSYVYLVRYLNHDGLIVYQTEPAPDQSEFMHWTKFQISVSNCILGFFIALLVIPSVEFPIRYRKLRRNWYPESEFNR